MKVFRKLVILSHRYLGIVLSLMVIMWFATGITMMYWGGMPRVTPELRLERLDPVDFSRVQLTPAQAAERGLLGDSPGRASLLTVLQRPAYRFGGRDATTVFADTGDVLDELTLSQSRDVAARFMKVPATQVHHVRTLHEVDQWTLQTRLPLHKFTVDNEERRQGGPRTRADEAALARRVAQRRDIPVDRAAGTELYVQPATGEVVMMTTRSQRGWAWVSTIPHWMYFTALRTNQPLWYRFVVWTSALACVLSVLGLILSLTQFRKSRPFRLADSIPYAGSMRWHYISGAVFGVFTLTFAFSGLVSMEPWEWTNARGLELPRDVFTGGRVDLSQFTATDADAWNRVLDGRQAKEIEFTRLLDGHYYVVRQGLTARDENDRERLHQPYPIRQARIEDRLLIAADTLAVRRDLFDEASLVAKMKAAVPDTPILESEVLTEYDSYYYSRAGLTPLPALRVKFADPMETWVYVDPSMSEVVTAVNRMTRVERWVYHGLHSLDFAFLYNSRPAWDIVMLLVSFGGLTTSVLGLLLGIRRMRRAAKRMLPATESAPYQPSPAADAR